MKLLPRTQLLVLGILSSHDKGYASIPQLRTSINALVNSRYGHDTVWRVVHTLTDMRLLEKFHFGSNRPKAKNIMCYRLTDTGKATLEENRRIIAALFGFTMYM